MNNCLNLNLSQDRKTFFHFFKQEESEVGAEGLCSGWFVGSVRSLLFCLVGAVVLCGLVVTAW